MARNDPTVNIDRFFGIRNKEQSRRLEVGSLEVADNVDIDDTGGIVLRNGYVLAQAFTDITACFSTQDENRTFIIDSGVLYRLNSDFTAISLATGMTAAYIYWLEVADFIIMSSGHIIDKNNVVSLWRIPNPPSPNFELTTGYLAEGQYQVVCTYVNEQGREGGASDVVVLNVGDGSEIIIRPEYNGYKVRVYVTDTNGEVFYLYAEYQSGQINIVSTDNLIYPIDKAQLKSYPAPDNIQQLAFYEGKLWCAEASEGQSILWISQEFWWNLFDLQNNFIIVPGKINMIVGTSQGLIIGTDSEIYVYTTENLLVQLADYGVPEGKPYDYDDNRTFYIHTKQGLCTALPFANLTQDKVSLPPGFHCYTVFIDYDGMQQVVVLNDALGAADNLLN